VKPFGQRSSFHNKAEWIVDLTTRADRDGKHAEYADRYDSSDLRVANLKELDLQLDRGYRVCGLLPLHSLRCLHALRAAGTVSTASSWTFLISAVPSFVALQESRTCAVMPLPWFEVAGHERACTLYASPFHGGHYQRKE
jgi:hypothetical protein